MLGIKEILKDPKKIEAKVKSKEPDFTIDPLLSAYDRLCKAKTELDQARSELNSKSKEIGERKRKGEDASEILLQVGSLKTRVKTLDEAFPSIETEYEELIAQVPNIPDDDIKISPNPEDNIEVGSSGQKPQFSFPILNHLELNEKLELLDFKRGAKLSGTGWPVYKDRGARLEWALLNLMIDTHLKNGFIFHLLPHLVRPEIMFGAGQLPKFENQLFKIKDEDYNLYLIPTSEVVLNGLHSDEILNENELPKLYIAYTPCFRREAGAAGKAERGLIRVHQFNKVEMFAFTKPEDSDQIFAKMQASAEEVLQKLELHYRNMLLVTGDMSYGAARTLDIEVWLPGQDSYMEVSSISNCRNFQARRSKIRYKDHEGKTTFVHTLNGSGLATARLMVALLENNQQADGSIILPKALHSYYGSDRIEV